MSGYVGDTTDCIKEAFHIRTKITIHKDINNTKNSTNGSEGYLLGGEGNLSSGEGSLLSSEGNLQKGEIILPDTEADI